MNPVPRAAQRLLALGITASTLRLVRGLREGRDGAELQAVMAERRRLLRELENCDPLPEIVGQLDALRAAVAESDRTVELLVA